MAKSLNTEYPFLALCFTQHSSCYRICELFCIWYLCNRCRKHEFETLYAVQMRPQDDSIETPLDCTTVPYSGTKITNFQVTGTPDAGYLQF